MIRVRSRERLHLIAFNNDFGLLSAVPAANME